MGRGSHLRAHCMAYPTRFWLCHGSGKKPTRTKPAFFCFTSYAIT